MKTDSQPKTKTAWISVWNGRIPAKTSPSGNFVPARIVRRNMVINTKGKLRLGAWGQHGWHDVVDAITARPFGLSIAEVELRGEMKTGEFETCAKSMKIVRMVDASKPIVLWVIGQAERLMSNGEMADGFGAAFGDALRLARKVAESRRNNAQDLDELKLALEILPIGDLSTLERAIISTIELVVAHVSQYWKPESVACKEAIGAMLKLADKRFEYPAGLRQVIASAMNPDRAKPKVRKKRSNAARLKDFQAPAQNAPKSAPTEKPVEQAETPEALYPPLPTAPRMSDFDVRVLSRLRHEKPRTNVRLMVIAEEFGRPEEEVRAAAIRLSRVGLVSFLNQRRREAHAVVQPMVAEQPMERWLDRVIEQIKSARGPHASLAEVAQRLGLSMQDIRRICIVLNHRGMIQFVGQDRTGARLVGERVKAGAKSKTPSFTLPSGDAMTTRTNGTSIAESVLSNRPDRPPTRRVQHTNY